ncbi:MAG: hypothetical protein ACRCZS_16280 [Chroococcidiopsis sp.]
MDAYKSPSPTPDDNPILEIRSYLAVNQQVIRELDKDVRENTIDTRAVTQKVVTIESNQLVIINRLDRLENDYKEDKQLAHSWKTVAWGALLTAIFAVVTPFVIRPVGVSSSGVSQIK